MIKLDYSLPGNLIYNPNYDNWASGMSRWHINLDVYHVSMLEQASRLNNVSSLRQPFINSSLERTPSLLTSILLNISLVLPNGASAIESGSASVIRYIAWKYKSGHVCIKIYIVEGLRHCAMYRGGGGGTPHMIFAF